MAHSQMQLSCWPVCNMNSTYTTQSSHKQAFSVRQKAHQCQNGNVRIFSSATTVLHVNVVTDCTVNPLKGESLDKISTTLAIQTHGNELFPIVMNAYCVCLRKGLKDTAKGRGRL